jgi:hypothetical protein
MQCSYHPEVESQEKCTACNKFLCNECAHRIKGKPYCQDCLVQGAEWATTVKGLHIPADAPRRAAICALIPGMGAVYNNEYLKAITYFAVFASLVMMGDKVNGVFGFGSFAFLVFTMFDAYRMAELKVRKRIESGGAPEEPPGHDKTIVGWGIFLIILGVLFLLQNIIPYYFLSRLWPLLFILLGAYLVYRAFRDQQQGSRNSGGLFPGSKEGI